MLYFVVMLLLRPEEGWPEDGDINSTIMERPDLRRAGGLRFIVVTCG